jgi:arsenate reductase
MAEGFASAMRSEDINPFSAGISPGPIDPLAIKVMQEVEIDISRQETHAVRDFLQQDIDQVVTVCSTAAEKCPTFPPEVAVICQAFDDPPALTKHLDDEEEKLVVYRRVRDEIRQFVENLPE